MIYARGGGCFVFCVRLEERFWCWGETKPGLEVFHFHPEGVEWVRVEESAAPASMLLFYLALGVPDCGTETNSEENMVVPLVEKFSPTPRGPVGAQP